MVKAKKLYKLPKLLLTSVKNICVDGDPYIEKFDETKSIFVHVPKNAGISLEKAIYEEKVGHHHYMEYAIFSPIRASEYFSFSFVRNPWSRVRSAFYFLKKGGRNSTDKLWAEKHLGEFERFDEFVRALQDDKFRKTVLEWQHFQPQIDYLINPMGKVGVDFIGRVESIEKDFKHICNKIGDKTSLPHLNKSSLGSYKSEYSEKEKNIVEKIYQSDIQCFDYSF